MIEHDLRDKVLAYLKEHNAMTVATVAGGQPWAAAVFYAHDDKLNLYFLSDPRSRHSQQLKDNPKVSVAVNEDYKDWREIRGIQLEGAAVKVTSPVEKAKALALYLSKFPFVKQFVTSPLAVLTSMAIAGKPFAVEVYRVTPERLFYLDNRTGFSNRLQLL